LKIGEGGELEKHSITTEGRAYGMQKILDKLLHQHLSLGLHRNYFNEADDIDEVIKQLRIKGRLDQSINI
jgi:hypothetical protein